MAESSCGEGGAERVTWGAVVLELLVSRISQVLWHTYQQEQQP